MQRMVGTPEQIRLLILKLKDRYPHITTLKQLIELYESKIV